MTDISPSRTGLLTQTFWRSPGSRAHCFLTCLESSTTPSPASHSRITRLAGIAFHDQKRVGTRVQIFGAQSSRPPVPLVYASLWLLAESQARLEAGMKSLLLFRRALSSPTMCRFIPALSGHPLPKSRLLVSFDDPLMVDSDRDGRLQPMIWNYQVVSCQGRKVYDRCKSIQL